MNTISGWLNGDNSSVLSQAQRATHTYVIGQPGTGKSRALESWIRQDIRLGHGVGVIDPHGDLYNHLVDYLANKPEVWERVILLDPCHPKWTLTFNPLQAIEGLSSERLSLFMTDIVIKIWGIDPVSAPRLVWLLTNTFLALSRLKLSLLDLPHFLTDGEYRERLLPQVGHAGVQAYFMNEFPKSTAAAQQWIAPVLNKIGGLIFDPDIRLMLAGRPRFSFREVMDNRLIFLANISKGVLGEAVSSLLGAFLVAQIQKAALSRADSIHRLPYYLYLDEFQNYTTDNIEDILSESRKYALSLTLANQFLDQITPRLRSAVLNTTGTMVCFRVGYQDAAHLVRDIFPSPDFMSTTKNELKLSRSGGLPWLTIEERQDEIGWDGLTNVLTQTPARSFWYRSRNKQDPIFQRAFYIPDPIVTQDLKTRAAKFYDASGRRYGRLKTEARNELNHEHPHETRNPGNNLNTSDAETGDSPFWGR
jgi:hypothetical protein